MTLREIITAIIDGLDRPFDIMLYNRIRPMVLSEAAYLMRQQGFKYGLNKSYLVSYTLALVADGDRLKTVSQLPTPLRLDNGSIFYYVGSVSGKVPYMYATKTENIFMDDITEIGCAITYEFIDNYLYIDGTEHLKNIKATSQYNVEYIDSLEKEDGDNKFTDDMVLPVSEDLNNTIINKIISSPAIRTTDAKDKVEAAHIDNI